MADALCGPSSALQTFQKHTSTDRTLQQDRLTSKRPAIENFRSTPQPSSPHVESDFQAFQARPSLGNPVAGQKQSWVPNAQSFQHSAPGPAGAAAWAADFQRLEISTPIVHQSAGNAPPLQTPRLANTTPWHNDFIQQQSTGLGSSTFAQPFSSNYAPSFQAPAGLASLNAPTYSSWAPQSSLQHSPLPDHTLEKAQFEDAFASVDKDMDARTQAPSEAASHQEPVRFDMSHACTDPGDITGEYDFDESLIRNARPSPLSQAASNPVRIGADAIEDESQAGPLQPNNQHDALAQTAGQVLDSLQHESGAKFQRSTFMELMRQLRDHEVVVAGDQMVSAAQGPHPGGEHYPADAFRATDAAASDG